MADERHLDILKQGVETWNQWRKENPGILPYLSRANLFKADLRDADLTRTNLREADLTRANLSKANLNKADLRGANLFRANLSVAELHEANLGRASLREAELREANLTGADLSWADLYRANLFKNNLNDANLRGTELYRANLREAELRRTNLREASLFKANVSLANLDRANLSMATLNRTNLSWANLSLVDLSEASLVETNLERADLSGCRVYGVSAWNVNLKQTIQKDLIITKHDEPVVMVDDLEVAQFVYLLLHRDKLRNVLNAVTEKGILILGRFGGGGLDALRAMADRLRDLGYLPIIFDFERPRDRRYTETVKTLVGMARFAIVDLSGPSVPQELYATVPFYKIPFVPILEAGRSEYSLFADLLEEQNVLKPVIEFDGIDDLLAKLPDEIIGPAENYVVDRQKLLAEIFGRQA